jgi:hypothetical protein
VEIGFYIWKHGRQAEDHEYMLGQKGRSFMNDWISQQVALLKGLEGCVIQEWSGIEMAVREVGPEGVPQWYDDAVPVLQLVRLDLRLPNGHVASIATYQNDIHWGLRRRDNPSPSLLLSRTQDSIYRERLIDELPTGIIKSVEVVLDASAEGDISNVNLQVGGHTVSLRAAEVDERCDGSLIIVSPDESVLVQVDGRRPNKGFHADADKAPRR